MSDEVARLLDDFVKKCRGIISDGDLDGIFATGFVIHYLRKLGVDIEYRYPAPNKLRGLVVSGYIIIELPLTKGLVYQGENILIDHHNGPARVELFEEDKPVKSFYFGEVSSVAELVSRALGIDIDKELLDAVNQIDSGKHETKLAEMLHKAYLLNISSSEMRKMLTKLVAEEKWSEIKEWAKREYSRWSNLVEPRIDELIRSAKPLVSGVIYFIYREDSDIDKAARTLALMKLEEICDIAISIGIDEHNKALKARIATKKPIDLTTVFEQLRSMGHNAGGRANVGGVQFNNRTLDEAITDLREVKWPR